MASPAQGMTQAPPLGPERPVQWPARTRTRLANGLEILLAEVHSVPKFCGELVLRSGNAAAASRAPGLAGMTATVVRTGTSRRASREIEESLRGIGADLSSRAGADSAWISFAGLSEFSEPLLWLVGELAREASFPQAEFERERRQKLEELRIDRTTPGFLAGERLLKTLFGAHPYANLSPSEKQVEAYRREDLLPVYREHYSPANALFVAVGDFQPDVLISQIEKIFGDWKGPAPARNSQPVAPLPRGRRVHLVHLPGAVQAQILVGSPAIARKDPGWLRYVLANSIYGGAFNSRLVMNIREDKGYTYSPRSSANSFLEHGYWSVSAAVRNEVAAATLTEIFYEMDRMRSLSIPEQELADAKSYLSGVFSLGLGTQGGILGQIATVALHGLPEDYLETYRERVRALTAAGVQSAAQQQFDSAAAQIVVVGDRTQIESQAALFGELQVYDSLGNPLPA